MAVAIHRQDVKQHPPEFWKFINNEVNYVNANDNTEIIQLEINKLEIIIQIRRHPRTHPLQIEFKV